MEWGSVEDAGDCRVLQVKDQRYAPGEEFLGGSRFIGV